MAKGISAKKQETKDCLQERIVSGKYGYGNRLPTVVELAEELGVSYVTVSKAIKLLEKEGYLQCRHGVGNFATYRMPSEQPGRKIVNLISPAIIHDLIRTFQEQGKEMFSTAGWDVRSYSVSGDLTSVREVISDPDTYSVIFGFRPYWENFTACMEHVVNRVVLIGERGDPDGVACVTCDEPQSIRLLMSHLTGQGINRIAMVCANLRSHLEMQRVATWRSLCLEKGLPFAWCRDYCYDLALPPMAPVKEYVKNYWQHLQQQGLPEAVITPDAEVAAQLIGLAMDAGVRLPEELAVTAIGNSEMAEIFRPQITCIDSNFSGHLKTALEILESRVAGYRDNAVFYLCQPRLVVHASSDRKCQKRVKNYHTDMEIAPL